MTLPEFLEKLEQTPRDWFFTHDNHIRRGNPVECPITSLNDMPADCWFIEAQTIGLESGDVAFAIANASDNRGQKRLRKKLLKACGLESA